MLAGDWLYMQSFQMALAERNFKVLDILIDLTQSMVEGEVVQLSTLGRMDLREEEVIELAMRKTACLSAAARGWALFWDEYRKRKNRGWPITGGMRAWRSSWWTTCLISRHRLRSSASRC